ncbi:MAG TPA: PilZ domain-containing protein [Syntrophales bacterium]|nr:PilZ domain-containing protein [Syntrophales bacterium]
MSIDKNSFCTPNNRREYSRVNAHLAFGARVVPPDEREGLWANVSSQAPVEFGGMPEINDEALADWLTAMNRKLDLLINMMTQQKEGFSSLPIKQVNISGGGLSFSSREPYDKGDVLEIKMILPFPVPVSITVYGDVVAAEEKGDKLFEVGVKFADMDDEIREEICKFVFHRERQILREKRR